MSEKIPRWVDAHLLLLLLLIFVFRGAFLLINGLGLVGDESYYWDWSRRPDWCYFSKPPMVAWLIGISTWLFGDNTAALRLPAVVLGTVFLWYFHATASAYFGRRAAALALLLMLAMPDNVVANLVMGIDPPLYCFWMISLYYLRRALFDQHTRAWFWAGCAGAAALLSKQVAIALPIATLLFILLDRRRHGWLKREFLLYLLPILIAIVPIMFWNQQHDWVMFNHVKGHFANQSAPTLPGRLKFAGEFFLYQILLISPIIFAMTLICSLQNIIGFTKISAEKQFLTLAGPVMLMGVIVLSLIQKVQGNWPMQFYFTALILLSGHLAAGNWKKNLKSGLICGYVLVGVTYLLPAILQVFHIQNTKFDPIRRFRFWHELADNVQIQRQRMAPELTNSFVLTLGHRYMASELAFYLPDHPQVFRYERGDEITSQYEVWPGPLAFAGKNAFVLSDALALPEPIKTAFKHLKFLGVMPNPKSVNSPYYIYLGESLENWPVRNWHSVAEE